MAFYPIKDGSVVTVGEGYRIHLPPPPPKELILFSDYPKEEQHWRRQPLPDNFMERYLEERYIRDKEFEMVQNKIKKSVTHVDQHLERYRRQEWIRRTWGVWFMNNGVPTYLTNHHYFYLQWCKFDHKENDGYPFYYEFSKDSFYIRQWCEENPKSLGYMIIGPRATGKSGEELACVINNTTRKHNHRAALQSKHFKDDAQGVLIQAKTVPIFNHLPVFFKPEYAHGSNPQEALIFNRDSKKGKEAKQMQFGPDFELNSTIFAAMPGVKALDSETLGEIFEDEIGKQDPKKVGDIYERHDVNVKCVFRNHRKVGLLRKTSTVEEMDKGGDECHKLWKDSDPTKLDKNGWTISKIHRHLISALDTDTSLEPYIDENGKNWGVPCNKYGQVNREIANIKIQNDLDAVAHDLKKRSSRMRKNPRTAGEAFIKDQSKSIFNVFTITNRMEEVRNMSKPPYVRGNLYWLDKESGPVGFKVDEHAGRFLFAWFPDEFSGIKEPGKWKILNNFRREFDYNTRGEYREMSIPRNDLLFAIGSDPIKFSKTKDPRASKASMHAFRKFDIHVDYGKPKAKWLSHNFFVEYIERPEDPTTYFDDAGMLCHFLGCSILPESNIQSLVQHFISKGWDKFLMYPKHFIEVATGSQDDPGMSSTNEVIDSYTRRLITFINEHCHRMPFDRTLESWLNFNPAETTTQDPTVSSGFTLIATEKKVVEEDEEGDDADDWMDMYDNSGEMGRRVDPREQWQSKVA